jgi:3-hydroxybutyrate dehydrogenase
MFLKGKTALVTGSTSGIGHAYAKAMASEGANVMINGFGDADEIEAMRQELESISGAKAAYSDADMSDPAAIEAMVAHCTEELGTVDIAIANAGIQHVSPIEDFPVEKWDQMVAINLSAPWHLTRLVVGAMKKQGWGRIIYTASAHSMVASPFKSAYNATKFGLGGIAKTVALETAQDGVTANCLSPGYVWTPLIEKQIPDTMKARGMTREEVINDVLLAALPTKKFVMPEEIASFALYLCRDEAAQITGANLSMDGGWTAQ